MKILIVALLICVSCTQVSTNVPKYAYKGKKIKGISFVAPHEKINEDKFQEIKDINANVISLMPYAFLPENTAKLRFTFENDNSTHKQWWGETPEGVRQCIKMAHNKGIEVMLKPHIWLSNGKFTGELDFKTEADWSIFEKSFSEYIIAFAKIAEAEKVEYFCIATEMASHVKERPQYWSQFIDNIRKVYKGKLSYAENWDSFEKVPFWNKLDFIGVDAYFPLSKEKLPEISDINTAWQKHINSLAKVSSKIQKPILFTEIGYRSNDYALEKPWETDYSGPPNEKIQALAYQSVFETVWKEPFMAGMLVWKWFPLKHTHDEDTFSPQNKPAIQILRKAYSEESFTSTLMKKCLPAKVKC